MNPTTQILISAATCDFVPLEQAVPGNINPKIKSDSRLKFEFSGIFNAFATQEKVFDVVCERVLDGLFDGVNGTVFVYGQTGSGKTFTMTGSQESYADRGLIPRCLEDIFSRIGKLPGVSFEV